VQSVVALIAFWLASADNQMPPGSRATVCWHSPIPSADAFTFERAEIIASNIFKLAGLRLDWHDYGKPCPADRDPILIDILTATPKDFFPSALGVSWPYEGVHIQIFYDRIALLNYAGIASAVLGHVLAHEIAHNLSGTEAHSATGVMKSRWDPAEMRDMLTNPMHFTGVDISILKNGLAVRHQRLVQLRNGTDLRLATAASQ